MSDSTIIAWTDRTWNPWRGCTKVSPGCDNCYMFTAQSRYGRDPSKVVRCGRSIWRKPYEWHTNEPQMVFTCSWSDWFHEAADEWRDEAWRVIRETPNLHYQILTKRPHLIADRLPSDWGDGYHNVWLGVSIESNNQRGRADRLRKIPAAIRFVSYEPALGPLDKLDLAGIDWLIYGGESGPGWRPEGTPDDPKCWARDIRDKCLNSGVAFFHKQSAAPRTEMGIELDGRIERDFPAYQEKAERRTASKAAVAATVA